ncbi:MAG: hypothetical protein WCJ94_04815 [bacterium]
MNSKRLEQILKAVFALVLVGAIYIACMSSFADSATLHHALLGKEFVKEMGFPKADTLSYTGDAKWNKSSWLFDIFTYSAAFTAGVKNLVYFKLFFFLLTTFMLFLIVFRKQKGKYISITIPIGLFGLILINYYLNIAPQAFSVIFAAYFMYVLEQEPSKRNAFLYYTLPFISLFWANIDNTVTIGTVLIFIYIMYYIVDMAEMPEKRDKYNSPAILIAFAGSAAASILSPSFVTPYTSLVQNFVVGQSSWLQFIKGSAPEKTQAVLLGVYLLIFIIIIALNERGADVGRKSELVRDIMTTLILLAACASDMAYVPVFIIITLPIVMYYAYLIFRWSYVWPKQLTETHLVRIKNFLYIIMIPIVLIYGVNKFMEPKAKLYPENAVAYIMNAQPPKNIFTVVNWTGYTGYYLSTYKTMWDGNFLRDQNVKKEYDIILKGEADIKPIIVKQGIKTFLLPAGTVLEARLKTIGFKPAFFDNDTIVLVNTVATKDYFKFINPFQSGSFYDKKNYKAALAELKDFAVKYPSVKVHSLISNMLRDGDVKKAVEYLENTIIDFPEEYPLYNTLGRLYYEEGELNSAMDIWGQSKEKDLVTKQLMKEVATRLKNNEE